MAKLTLKELENLSRLLLSPDDASMELGLELLKNNKIAIPMLRRELILIWQLHEELNFRKIIKMLLSSKYNDRELSGWAKGFAIFTELPSIYRYNTRVQELVKAHENVRFDYQSLIERNFTYSSKYYEIAYELAQRFKKHLKLAEVYYRIVLKVNSKHEDALFYLALLLDKSEATYEEALLLYQSVERITPRVCVIYNNIGLIYDKTNRLDLAYEYYHKALVISPDESLYMRNLGSLCLTRMDGAKYKEEARLLLSQLLEKEPASANNWNNWGDYLYKMKQYDEAEATYLKGLQISPRNPRLIGNLGELYIDVRKEYDKGLELYKKSLEYKSSPYRLVVIITLLVHHYTNYSAAKIYYKQLIQLSSPNQIIRSPYLLVNQWTDFLAAEKILLHELT